MGKERDKFFKTLPKNLNYEPKAIVKLGRRLIGQGQPAFIIAEVGANHRGDIKNAYKLIDKAKEAGADAVKFQHLTHDKIAADTLIHDSWNNKPVGKLSDFYKSAEMPYEWTDRLIAYAKKKGILFLSTPFDKEAVDILDKANVAAFKVASYELTDDILLEYIARKKRPVIISTGMADMEEIAHAIKVITATGNNQIIILHCVSMYPPNFENLNLKAIASMAQAFRLPVGFSDHSEPSSVAASSAAVTLGACVIEKHITDDHDGGSNDDINSMETDTFKKFLLEIRNTEKALSGSGIKQPVQNHGHKNDEIFDRFSRRSLYALIDMKAGDKVTEDKIITLRPWGGMKPQDLHLFVGKKLIKPIKAREALTSDHFLVS